MGSHYEVRTFDVGAGWFGDDARARTAKLLDLAQVAGRHELLHYNADGTTQQGFSPVKFLGRKNGFALLGYGERGLELIEQFAPAVASAWACAIERPVLQHAQGGVCSVSTLPYMMASRVPCVMVQKKPRHGARLERDPKAHVRDVLLSSFRRQADYLGLRLPEGFAIDVLDCRRVGAHSIAPGAAGMVMDVSFACNAVIDGIWSLGFLTSHGKGLYQPALERARALMPLEATA